MNSELLKNAIADAKAVRATALANAKAALEEAFTPKLQSMLSQKLQQEIEGEEEDFAPEAPVDEVPVADAPAPEAAPLAPAPAVDLGAAPAEEIPADDVAAVAAPAPEAAPVAPVAAVGLPADDEEEIDEYGEGHPDPVVQAELQEGDGDAEYKKTTSGHKTEDPQGAKIVVKKIEGTKGEPKAQGEPKSAKAGHKTPDPQGASNEFTKGPSKDEKNATGKVLENSGEAEDEIGTETLEEILSELEREVNDVAGEASQEAAVAENCGAEAVGAESAKDVDEEIDLNEILSEEKDEDEDEEKEEKKDEDDKKPAFLKENISLKAENEEYRKAVIFLRDRLNEVNLLNAKLLYTNRLFKQGALTKEQKIKVIETFDLTKSVREAKLVYATLAESLNFGAAKKPVVAAQTKKVAAAPATAKAITEGLASKAVASTKPTKQPEVLTEGAEMAERFKKLAGIRK